jgi:hypothetical protein
MGTKVKTVSTHNSTFRRNLLSTSGSEAWGWTRDLPICALSEEHTANLGRAVAQRLDAGFPPRRPGFAYGQHVGFVVDIATLGQVFSEYFGFPCQSFHRFLHYHNHPELTQ